MGFRSLEAFLKGNFIICLMFGLDIGEGLFTRRQVCIYGAFFQGLERASSEVNMTNTIVL